MFVVVKSEKYGGGYCLEWQGDNKPSYVIGGINKNRCCWYKRKYQAVAKRNVLNHEG